MNSSRGDEAAIAASPVVAVGEGKVGGELVLGTYISTAC